jgi:hypothetical protein
MSSRTYVPQVTCRRGTTAYCFQSNIAHAGHAAQVSVKEKRGAKHWLFFGHVLLDPLNIVWMETERAEVNSCEEAGE